MADVLEAEQPTRGPRLSARRKAKDGKIAQPIYMTNEFHDSVVEYCEARRKAGMKPWKVSQLFRQSVEEFIARNPVGAVVAQPGRETPKGVDADPPGAAAATSPPEAEKLGEVSGSSPLDGVAPSPPPEFHD
jgi:hypothetical protein